MRASLQRHQLGGFATLSERGIHAAGVAEPDERSSTEVCDEEGDLARTQLLHEMLAEHVGGGDRGASSTAASSAPRSSPADGWCAMPAILWTMHRKNDAPTRRVARRALSGSDVLALAGRDIAISRPYPGRKRP